MGEKSAWLSVINYLRKRELTPMVAFCFSKKKVDASADCLTGLDMTDSSEKGEIHRFCEKALSRRAHTADTALPRRNRSPC